SYLPQGAYPAQPCAAPAAPPREAARKHALADRTLSPRLHRPGPSIPRPLAAMKHACRPGVWYHIPHRLPTRKAPPMPDLSAIIFAPALAGSVIFGLVFALFAAHHYLTAVQRTGSVARDVVSSKEPILDHFCTLFSLARLID